MQPAAKEDVESHQLLEVKAKPASLKGAMNTLFSKLVDSNLKSVCLTASCDEKL
jgi:hypothetical protein